MAVVQRSSGKGSKPDITTETVKAFGLLSDIAKYMYRNEEQFPAGKYEDISDNTMIPSVLFGSDQDLYYTVRSRIGDAYVQRFGHIDEKAYLRGQYKRSEIGIMFADILKDEHEKKPGQSIVTPKQHYVPIGQDQCAPIQDIHIRSFVDGHQFDFSTHFNSFTDYAKITSNIFGALAGANALLAKLLVDTFIVSLFGGFLHCYPNAHPLYRFFGDAADVVPDEAFSKLAKAFYDQQGEVSKRVQELSKWVGKGYKARMHYLTNLIDHEVIGQNVDKKVKKYTEQKVDLSTKQKTLEAMRKGYLKTDAAGKYTETGHSQRRMSLYSFASALDGTIYDMTQLDAKNGCGHDFYAEQKDKIGRTMQARPEDLIVFMNNEDLSEIRYGLKGSEASGVFTEMFNGKIERWERQGVTFYGLNFIAPGTAAIVDQVAFSLREYFHGDYEQFHAYDLITSRIKHVYVKPVLYEKVVSRVITPAAEQKFAVPAYGGSKNLPFLAEHN